MTRSTLTEILIGALGAACLALALLLGSGCAPRWICTTVTFKQSKSTGRALAYCDDDPDPVVEAGRLSDERCKEPPP